MTMTLDQEKEKLDHEHGLAIKRIFLEKLILGVIVVAFGVLANMGLEKFKYGLADRRYQLEKHDRILSDLRQTYSDMAKYTFYVMHTKKREDTEGMLRYTDLLGKYRRALDRIAGIANTSGRHLSKRFSDRIQQHLWFHEAIAFQHRRPNKKHWSFAVSVFDNFDALTRYATSGDRIEIKATGTHGGFPLIGWTSKTMLEKKAGAYYDQLYAKWQRENPSRATSGLTLP